MSRNRYLIVSAGSIGRRHLKNLRTLCQDAEIGVLRLHHDAESSPLPAGADLQFSTLDDALAFSPRAAIIASPAPLHAEIGLQLALSGIHLLIEKPLAHTREDSIQLLRATAERKLCLMVGYNLRFFESLQNFRTLIDEKAVGEVFYVRAEIGQYLPDWRPGTDYRSGVTARADLGGGVLLELSHEIDYLCWMFGMPDFVTATGGKMSELEIDVEDCVDMLWEYRDSKLVISIHLDMLQRTAVRSCKVLGDTGRIEWNALDNSLEITPASATGRVPETLEFPDHIDQTYQRELSVFLSHIDKGLNSQICPGGEDGLRVLSVVEAARAALQLGTKQAVQQS